MSKFLILTGPSAVGKSTVIKQLLKDKRFHLSVSYTTRAPRPHETNGVDYVFVSKDEFEKMMLDGLFLEHTVFGGNYYGTPATAKSEERITIFDIDVRGYYFFRKNYPHSYFCLLVADKEAVVNRLMKRIQTQKSGSSKMEVEERLKSFELFNGINNLDCFNTIIDNSGTMDEITRKVDDLIKESVDYIEAITNN